VVRSSSESAANFNRRSALAIACGIAVICFAPLAAFAEGECRLRKEPPVYLKNMGPCVFDPTLQMFAGDFVQQATCLLIPVLVGGKLGQMVELPAELRTRVGLPTVPAREALQVVLEERGFQVSLGGLLSQPVSRARDGDPQGRIATYFVIHDTSGPNYLGREFPAAINEEGGFNKLANILCANKIERAHTFISRTGAILVAHDYAVPWRATKFEMAQQFGAELKGLFLHTELVQPRRREPHRGWANDYQAPVPGFTQAQYDALALAYVVASIRAGFWMIPAYHAVIDEGIYNKHDDPQNFDLNAFAKSLKLLVDRIDSVTPWPPWPLSDELRPQTRPVAAAPPQ
jgi:hypothetical protein